MSQEYPYSEGDLLEKRNTYQYSRYLGMEFLGTWRDSRMAAREELGSAVPAPSYQRFAEARQYPVASRVLLEDLAARLACGNSTSEDDRLLRELVKRFEVTKRVFESYNEQLRAVDRERYYDPLPYMLFAEVMDLAYEAGRALPFLNALLKVIDTLVAIRERLEGDLPGRLVRLIDKERLYVSELATKAGVVLGKE